MHRLIGLVFAIAVLTGCAGQPSSTALPAPLAVPESDPRRCLSRVECTTKVSRTLLFVFDYAAAGAPLLQRDGRLLFTPADAPPSAWPALYIRLAQAQDSRFDFNGQCRGERCRVSVEQMLQIYRSYLAGRPCGLRADQCPAPFSAALPAAPTD
ncbi:hypothetical protein [Pseudomonas sp.]|uniref:hypothetical protein n=1 Tax=Pseudomonas sp. TaxID=306 RepID=UPI0027326297|nr:hypothetical protein [Pseudomonas sp.]MDP3816177.1 hypothetical protein [Pseudomonas sp.]